MRRIAVINQKGGVGKTTTTASLGAALALQGRRVVVVDMDAQANLSLSLGVEARADSPTSYTLLMGSATFAECLRPTNIAGLSLVASHLDLSGAELELASAMGREYLLRDALREWESVHRAAHGPPPADYVLFDCPPSLGLLSINALAASGEVLITLQTEFLALQGMSKLVDVVQLLKRRLNPELEISAILACLYDSRLKLAREVLGEIRRYFPGLVVDKPIRASVKLAEAPSFGQTIFEYADESHAAEDYRAAAASVMALESRDKDLEHLPAFDATRRFPRAVVARVPPRPPPRKNAASVPPVRVETLAPKPVLRDVEPARTSGAQNSHAAPSTPAVKRNGSAPLPRTKIEREIAADAGARAIEAPKPVVDRTTKKAVRAHTSNRHAPRATHESTPVVESTPHSAMTNDVASPPAVSAANESKPVEKSPTPKVERSANPVRSSRKAAAAPRKSAKPANGSLVDTATMSPTAARAPAVPERESLATTSAPAPSRKSTTRARAARPASHARTAARDAILVDNATFDDLPPDAFEILSHGG